MRRISIVGEGYNDHGSPERNDEDSQGDITLFLKRILQELLGKPINFDPIPIPKRELRISTKRNDSSWRRRTERAISLAVDRDYTDAIVVLIDDRQEQKPFMINQLKDGRSDAINKNKQILIVIGVAVKEIEAWLVADEKALRKVFRDKDINCYNNPEDLDDPKREYSNLYGHYKKSKKDLGDDILSEKECRREIIKSLNLDILLKRCSKGFRPFFEEVRALQDLFI